MFFVDGRRIPNAVLVNLAQRVDLVRDMLDGTAEQKLADAREHWRSVTETFVSAKGFMPEVLLKKLQPEEGLSPRLIVETTRKMNAKSSGKRTAEGNADLYVNLAAIPLKLSPSADYVFMVLAEGDAGLAVIVDGRVAVQATPGVFPSIACRLLTPAQQNTGDPSKPRPGCASAAQRTEGMSISDPLLTPRDVELVLINNRMVDDALATADLNYTIRVYQWVPARQSSLQ